LPLEIGALNQLRVLNISSNQLTKLPPELYELSQCSEFFAHENPLVEPPLRIVLKGRPHIFKWLRWQSIENNNNSDWCFNRGASVNATLRRTDRSLLERNVDRHLEKKVERRSRSTRFHTTSNIGGSDSGYASTGDEHRHSTECADSLVEADRLICYKIHSTVPQESFSGDLMKEVMLTYAEEVMSKSLAASTQKNGQSFCPSVDVATLNKALDMSNNNCTPESDIGQTRVVHKSTEFNIRSAVINKPSRIAVSSVGCSSTHEALSPVYENPSSPIKPLATAIIDEASAAKEDLRSPSVQVC
jgi:hypothetical protein